MSEDGIPTGRQLRADIERPGLRDMIRRNRVGNGSAPVLRRACFDQAGLFRPELRACEDYEMWCRLLHRTKFRAERIDAPLTLYRQRDTSLSYDPTNFVAAADAAMRYLRAEMPEIPAGVFNAGQAEHYRIAAWRAARRQRVRAARRLMLQAIRLHPRLPFTNARAAAAALWMLWPHREG
jgi:hypothetical protein